MTINDKKTYLLEYYKGMAIDKDIPVTSLYDALYFFSYKYLNTNIIIDRRLSYETSQFYISIINSIYIAIFYKSKENKTIEAVEKIINYIKDISKYPNVKDIPSYNDEYKKDIDSILTRQEILLQPLKRIKELHGDG